MVPGVATLDRSPDQSPGGGAHIPQYRNCGEPGEVDPPGWSTDQVGPGEGKNAVVNEPKL